MYSILRTEFNSKNKDELGKDFEQGVIQSIIYFRKIIQALVWRTDWKVSRIIIVNSPRFSLNGYTVNVHGP